MACTTKKVCKLDAICAKLKSISNDGILEPQATSTPFKVNSVISQNNENNNTNLIDNNIPNGDIKNHVLDIQEQADVPSEKPSYDDTSFNRRKKRKASTPRNIAQVREVLENYEDFDEKDELAEYEINNLNTTFPPEDDESDDTESPNNRVNWENCNGVANGNEESLITDDGSPINVPSTHSIERKHSRKARKPQSSVGIPLDLTVSRPQSDQDSLNDESFDENISFDVDEPNTHHNTAEDLSVTSDNSENKCSKSDSPDKSDSSGISMSALKDYAENTMNELLQMYGFSGSDDSGIGQVSQKKLLQTVHGLTTKGNPSNLINSIIRSPLQFNGSSGPGQLTPVVTPLPGSLVKKGIYANFVSTASKLKQQSSSDGKPRITISQGCTSAGAPIIPATNTQVIIKPSPVGAVPRNEDTLKNNTDFIKSVLNQQKQQNSLTSGSSKQLSPDYSTYLKRFSNGQECGVKYCKELSYREHFHCMDCNFRVFIKKEEMVRHFKWHRKREESLQHGFMRYSPMDDCSNKFSNCTHNGRQTHYHCLQDCCDKVYISTSDVQMHANYHRKDSAIIQEGFQRFRATEDCGTLSCAFYGQRTTHFHCRRNSCNFTFKNKADMEKHKTYHQKDEVLGRDGFKKFMKYEHCGYFSCRYSKVSNHIHCIRTGCNYVLHSTAQLYSHKRKHERRDFEAAYRKYREDGSSKDGPLPEGVTMATQVQLSDELSMSLPVAIKREPLDDSEMGDDFDMDDSFDSSQLPDREKMKSEPDFEDNNSSDIMSSAVSENSDSVSVNLSTCGDDSGKLSEKQMTRAFNLADHVSNISGDRLGGSLNLPIPTYISQSNQTIKKEATSPQEATPAHAQTKLPVFIPTSLPTHAVTTIPLPARPPERMLERKEKDESWKNYLIRYTANDPCNSRCQYLYKDHYHCKVGGCLVLFKSKDGVREHARFHELQDRITPVAYESYELEESCRHSCQYNLKEKHYHCIWSGCSHVVPHAGPTFGRLEHYRIHEFARTSAGKSYKSTQKVDDNSPRKRGRPPKYPKNEIPVIPKVELSEEEIQESRKLSAGDSENAKVINGFRTFAENELCPDELCIYRSKHHFHCARPRCHHATDRLDVLNLHAKDFHNFVTILEGFEFFDRNINCRRAHCHNNKANRHFHCVKPKCDYSFVRHSTMIQHDKKHKLSNSDKPQSIPLKKDIPLPSQGFIPIVPALPGTSVIQTVPGTPLVKVSLSNAIFPVSVSPALTTMTSLATVQTLSGLSCAPSGPLKSSQPGTVIVSPMSATAAAQAVSTGHTSSSASSSLGAEAAASNTADQPDSCDDSTVPTGTPFIIPGTDIIQTASNDPDSKPVIKTSGTYFPLSGLSNTEGLPLSSVAALSYPNSNLAIAVNPVQTIALSTLPLISPSCGTTVASLASPLISTAVNQLPLTVLLQQKGNNTIPLPSWTLMREKMHYSVDQNCGRPFCKLKKKDHFHCFDCNQAFSDPARIKIHVGKHGLKFSKVEPQDRIYQPINIAPKPSDTSIAEYSDSSESPDTKLKSSQLNSGDLSDVDSDEKSSSLNLNPSAFSTMIAKAQKENAAKSIGGEKFSPSDDYFSRSLSEDTDNDSISGKLVIADIDNSDISAQAEDDSLDNSMFSSGVEDGVNSSVSKWSGRKRTAPKHDDFVDSNTVVVKQRKTNNSPRTSKDDSIPEGYIRYRFKEDCKYPKCAYKQGVTHFHCARVDCGYSFSDRSRLIQHTLRHERIDSLTGGEMQQFRINQDCYRSGCEFVGKASHFHCLKCDYSCTDSSKVLTHRKHHAKMESINQQGFHKYSVSEDCCIELCNYSSKQTHYHCLKPGCNYAVTGPAQMSSHKMKHANDS